MQLKLLLDGIVQQTTVLLARLSTSSGVRSPLGHVADQVFLELARELEGQGMSKVLVADMFGMALRSYQRKTQRLVESATVQSRTLWEAIYDFVRESEVTRARIEERFKYDGERELSAVLTDLVRSGLLYVTGAGRNAVYGANSERTRLFSQAAAEIDALAHYAWFKVFQGDVTTVTELQEALRLDATQTDALLRELITSGRVTEVDGQLSPHNLVIPLGSSEGMETALLDHFRAATSVVAQRVISGPDATGRTGGSTFSFKMDPDHPEYENVMSLLQRVRSETQALWDRVMKINADKPPTADAPKVTFYVGQSVIAPSTDAATDP